MLITLATPRQDWTGSSPSRREGGGCGFTLSRSHSWCALRLVYTQIIPGHISTTLFMCVCVCVCVCMYVYIYINSKTKHGTRYYVFMKTFLRVIYNKSTNKSIELFYIHKDVPFVSANRVAIFREIKHKDRYIKSIEWNYRIIRKSA